MMPSEIQAEIRQLTRQLKALRRKLPKAPSKAFKGRTRAEDRKAKREMAAERRRRVYAAVDARSKGICEACGGYSAESHDHFWGRSKETETLETVWTICSQCDRYKTLNIPSRADWIQWFSVHCEHYDYRSQIAKCERALAVERAQHPEGKP